MIKYFKKLLLTKISNDLSLYSNYFYYTHYNNDMLQMKLTIQQMRLHCFFMINNYFWNFTSKLDTCFNRWIIIIF